MVWREGEWFVARARGVEVASQGRIAYCVMRMPLGSCWRVAVPESTATPNSARILAQRIANNFIRKYPGAAQLVLDDLARKVPARHR